jgi:branched-subunit amino acid aminotransferase/4-amino-4-deoxychorismate lyase
VNDALVYLNGQMIPAAQAHLAISDAGVVQGATVTEQTRTFRHRPFRLDDHLDRLFRSLRSTGMDIGLTRDELKAISLELVETNAALLGAGADLGLVQFVTAGEYPTYAALSGRPPRTAPTVCVHTFPLPFALWAGRVQTGAHLVTPSVRHIPPACLDPGMKCRSRMHFYLADREARAVDVEASALLLDLHGHVTETATANFLMVQRGTLVSPTTANILPGVSRATVIELAGRLGIPFVERDLPPADVRAADEAFLTSTPYCMMPVTKVNGTVIGDGRPGPVYRRLVEAWGQAVGVDIVGQIVLASRER